MKMIEMFENVNLSKRFVNYFNLEDKYLEIEKYNENFYKNFLHKAMDYQIYNILSVTLVEKYHNLLEENHLDGRTREERFNKFENIMKSKTFCKELINEYPVLDKVIKNTLEDYMQTIREILYNFKRDKLNIKKSFNIDFGNIVNIETEMGDKHNGRTVAKVIFENGILYYKPKSLLSDELLYDCQMFMTRHDITNFLNVKSLSFENHSWQEVVHHKPCKSVEEAERYYYRAGVLLSLMYVLNSYDMHHENIIASGEYPVIIDTETITSGRTQGYSHVDNNRGVETSVLNTSTLPIYNELYDINMSGFFPSEEKSERIYFYSLEFDQRYDIAYKKKEAVTGFEKNAVFVNNRLFNVKEAEQFLLKGFRAGANCILSNKQDFMTIVHEPKYKNLVVRQILRGTQVYYTFIRESQNPKILKSLYLYNQLFEILYNEFTPSKFGYLRVEKEIDDLQNGNVPYFYTLLNDHNLYCDKELICEKYYGVSPIENIVNTVDTLDEDMIEYQSHLIELCLFTATKTNDDYFGEKTGEINNSVKNFSLEVVVKKYIDEIKRNEVPNYLEKTSTIFIAQLRNGDNLSIDSIDAGLYIGGGIVYLLVVYSKKFNDIPSKELSRNIIKGLYKSYLNHYTITKDKNYKLPYGIYDGYFGLAFLSYNYYKAYDSEEMYSIFERIITDMFEQYETNQFTNDADEDFVNGLGGTVLFLGRLYFSTIAEEMKEKISLFIIKYYNFIAPKNFNEVGIAHGLSGKCIILSFVYRITRDKEVLNLLIKESKEERKLIDLEEQEGQIKYSWCRGLSGVILANSIISENLNDMPEFKGYFEELIQQDSKDDIINKIFTIKTICLCHGIFGNVDSFKYISKSRNIQKIEKYLSQNYLSKDDFNKVQWFHDSTYPFESFMTGASGVVYGLLHQIENIDIPSITALELYEQY